MLLAEKRITLEEYMQLPIGAPYQFINGYLVDWPSRTVDHQMALGRIATTCMNYLDCTENKGVCIMGPIEVVLDKFNSFQPDLIYVSEQNREIVKDYIYGPPDLVVEILWEKNAYYDLRPKKDIYEKYGVKEYFIFDPIAQNADLYVLDGGVFELCRKAEIEEKLDSILLPGLSFDLSKIFA